MEVTNNRETYGKFFNCRVQDVSGGMLLQIAIRYIAKRTFWEVHFLAVSPRLGRGRGAFLTFVFV